MSIPKLVGIEQEYALNLRGVRNFSPFHASCFLINSFADKTGLREPGMRMLWDYAHETPHQDIRGELFGTRGGQEIVSAEENLRINVALPNGARLYTDHAHPEYSTPECLGTKDVVACDKAGELILNEAVRVAQQRLPGSEFALFKNNVDHQGHSFGCHENYLMDARAHEDCLVTHPHKALARLVPFLVTRQVFAGAGTVGGVGSKAGSTPYRISQRSDFMEALFGLETMYARPIVNTRGEHHADETRFRRLHLILGDANMCEFAAVLKIGTTQLVLQMIEDDFLDEDLSLLDPVAAVRRISADVFCPVELASGRRATAIDIQTRFLEKAREYQSTNGFQDIPSVEWILESWEYALSGLEHLQLSEDLRIEDDPLDLTRRLDWVLKLWLLNHYRTGKGHGWDLTKLRVLDLQYHNVLPEQGVFSRLCREDMVERVLTDKEILGFVNRAPHDTRAYFRGKCIERYPREVCLVNWEVVGFDHGDVRRMIPLLDPLTGTHDQLGNLFETCSDSRELVRVIQDTAGGHYSHAP
ncbi:MAG: proteasome accessory factor PafA2 family protein [Thermodesulfobacteriota bacterium]